MQRAKTAAPVVRRHADAMTQGVVDNRVLGLWRTVIGKRS
jgi:hypothetical protein